MVDDTSEDPSAAPQPEATDEGKSMVAGDTPSEEPGPGATDAADGASQDDESDGTPVATRIATVLLVTVGTATALVARRLREDGAAAEGS